jgi:uncharacterized repeat protein (TIGR01451 family)
MATIPSVRNGSIRRRLVGTVIIGMYTAGLPWAVTSAGAITQLPVHGSATVANSCTVSLVPALQPPGVAPVSLTLSTDASPEPHTRAPVTLSNTTLTFTIPSALLQTAVGQGLIGDGFVIPAVVAPVLAGSNTAEATHTYLVSTTLTVHVINGVLQPLTATMNLANTTWHPIAAAAPVVITERSMVAVLTLDIPGLGTITATFDCTPGTAPAIVTLDGSQPLTTKKTADSSTAPAAGGDGYTITIHNPNASAVTLDAVTDSLPSGFSYAPGSTTGAVSSNPSINGQNLSWPGPISDPAGGNVSIHFKVTVSSVAGAYYNNAGAVAGGSYTVAPTGNTALVTVQTPSTQGNIFQVELRNCINLHVGYNRFPNGTVVRWNVSQNAINVSNGQFTAIGGGVYGSKTYHFLTQPLGVTLAPSPDGHVHFHWVINGVNYGYTAIRKPGC